MGAGIPAIGLKWRFHDTGKSRLAVKPEIRRAFSSGAEDRGLGNGPLNGGVALILTQDTGFGAVHANLSVNTFRFALEENRDLHRDVLWRLSVAPVFDLAHGWKAVFDAGLITNPHQAEEATMGYVEIGAIYSPNKDLDVALGFIRDLLHEGHTVYAVTTGVTWKFR
jgi:sirohydrochlorin ferrochelatase